ncbi:unnamed protein product, partial [Discosporangium mesarthrocarpum]
SFRRVKYFSDPNDMITAMAFARRMGGASRLWAGTEEGAVKLWETFGMDVEGRWKVSRLSITTLEEHPLGERWSRTAPGLLGNGGAGGAGASAPVMLSCAGRGEEKETILWRAQEAPLAGGGAGDDEEYVAANIIHTWPSLRAARFDGGGTRVVAVMHPHPAGLSLLSPMGRLGGAYSNLSRNQGVGRRAG